MLLVSRVTQRYSLPDSGTLRTNTHFTLQLRDHSLWQWTNLAKVLKVNPNHPLIPISA
jgi:hypothetical protein